jgi:hypothetical protein
MRSNPVQKLIEIRSDLQRLLVRLDDAINESGSMSRREPDVIRSRVPRMTQSYPEGYDFRAALRAGDRRDFHKKVRDLLDHVLWLDENTEDYEDEELRNELSLRAAEARLFQTQCEEGDPEWNEIVTVIRALTRISTDERPGFIYGLASSHMTDWGLKIEQVLSSYRPRRGI